MQLVFKTKNNDYLFYDEENKVYYCNNTENIEAALRQDMNSINFTDRQMATGLLESIRNSKVIELN